MKKLLCTDCKLPNQFLFTIVLLSLALGIVLGNLYGNYRQYSSVENSKRWEMLVEFEKNCSNSSLVFVRNNGNNLNVYCVSKSEIVDFQTRGEIERLLKIFRVRTIYNEERNEKA